jgi:hypothetical protein
MAEITIYTRTYGPWEEGADEPPLIGEAEEEVFPVALDEFDEEGLTLVGKVGTFLADEGLTEPSSSEPQGSRTWWADPDGRRPTRDGLYTGDTEERTAHVSGLSEEEHDQLFALLKG